MAAPGSRAPRSGGGKGGLMLAGMVVTAVAGYMIVAGIGDGIPDADAPNVRSSAAASPALSDGADSDGAEAGGAEDGSAEGSGAGGSGAGGSGAEAGSVSSGGMQGGGAADAAADSITPDGGAATPPAGSTGAAPERVGSRPADGSPPGLVTRIEREGGVTIRITTAKGDLTGRGVLLLAADRGRAEGDARCTQHIRFANQGPGGEVPSMLVCWRTSPARSVATLAVNKAGTPPPRAGSLAVIAREWAALG